MACLWHGFLPTFLLYHMNLMDHRATSESVQALADFAGALSALAVLRTGGRCVADWGSPECAATNGGRFDHQKSWQTGIKSHEKMGLLPSKRDRCQEKFEGCQQMSPRHDEKCGWIATIDREKNIKNGLNLSWFSRELRCPSLYHWNLQCHKLAPSMGHAGGYYKYSEIELI